MQTVKFFPNRQIEPWYIFMVILGAFNVGFNIMLVPQYVLETFENGVVYVGIVMAAWTAGPLLAPVISNILGAYGKSNHWISGLLFLNSILAVTVQLCTTIDALLINLFCQGLLNSLGYSIMNLLIIKRFPETEWHGRTGMLIAAFVLGEVIGFGISGLVPNQIFGFYLSSIVMGTAAISAHKIVPNMLVLDIPPKGTTNRPNQFLVIMRSKFGAMAIAWGLLCMSAQLFFLPYPVLMAQVYNINEVSSSALVSISGVIALLFYPSVGYITKKYGASYVLRFSSNIKILVFVALSTCALSAEFNSIAVMFILILFNRCTWPFMMASSQILAAQLSYNLQQSRALAVFMAVAGIGNTLSGFLNSLITRFWGMTFIPLASAVTASLAIIILLLIHE